MGKSKCRFWCPLFNQLLYKIQCYAIPWQSQSLENTWNRHNSSRRDSLCSQCHPRPSLNKTWVRPAIFPVISLFCHVWIYHQTSNISCTLVGNKIVDHSDVVGAVPVSAAPTTSSFPTWTPVFNILRRDKCKTRQETFKFWCLLYNRFDSSQKPHLASKFSDLIALTNGIF